MAAPELPDPGFFSDLTAPAPKAQGVSGGTAALDAIVAFIKTMIGGAPEQAVTLASDTFAPADGTYVVSSEGAPSTTTDNLAQIGTTNAYDGMLVELRPASGHTITAKHNTGSVGKLLLADAADLVLSAPSMRLWVQYAAGAQTWTETDRSYGANKAGLTAFLNAATDTLAGIIKAATIAIARTGTATDTAVTPDAMASFWQKGADIASASTLTKPADTDLGGYHLITGTTQVTAMWAGTKAGESYWFECAGALPVANGANLITKTGADMTFAAGDRFQVMFFGSSVWKMIDVNKADGTSVASTTPVLRGWISPDFAFSNNAATPNTKIDYSAGQLTDSGNAVTLSPAGGTINLATTGADALDTGSLASTTGYWLFIIAKADGTTKGLASLSRTAPTMPSGYTVKRRCGSFLTDGSAHVLPFTQTGRLFKLKTPLLCSSSTALTTASKDFAILLPAGKKFPIRCNITVSTSSGADRKIYIRDPDDVDVAPNDTTVPGSSAFYDSAVSFVGGQWEGVTDVTPKICARADGANAWLYVYLLAWDDDAL